jgi:biopolymer transport protein ExbD
MGARFDAGDELSETHEINVTPFIDVILVLLIIFMIAAPLSTVDISVDLPTSNAEPHPPPEKPIALTLKSDLTLRLDNEFLSRDALASALDRAANSDKQQRILLHADKSVSYGDLMALMNDLRAAGYLKIGLVGIESDRAP